MYSERCFSTKVNRSFDAGEAAMGTSGGSRSPVMGLDASARAVFTSARIFGKMTRDVCSELIGVHE